MLTFQQFETSDARIDGKYIYTHGVYRVTRWMVSYLSYYIEQNYIRTETLAYWVSCTVYGKLNFFSCKHCCHSIIYSLYCIHSPRRPHEIFCFTLEAQRMFFAEAI